MVYQEIRLGETKVRFLIRWACLLTILWLCLFVLPSYAQGLRLEASVGQCKHRLSEDTNWHYGLGGYQTNVSLNPRCGQVGALWKLDQTFGLRVAYVDLGTVTANNAYPTDEQAYISAKANHSGIVSGTEFLQGQGQSRGFTFGPAIEWKSLTAEAGVAYLYNTWHVMDPLFSQWDYADGWNTTWYVGGGFRYRSVTLGLRVYRNVHASQADVNPLAIGMTAGPVVQATVGISFGI